MRKDPPFDTEYIYATYILERAESAGALVVNRPRGLRDMNEKVYTAWFPQCCAPTLVTRDMGTMAGFVALQWQSRVQPPAQHGRPVDLCGRGRRSQRAGDLRDPDRLGNALRHDPEYLPEIVSSGDTRVLLIDGEPAPYALARIPASGDNRGNLAAGAQGLGRELNARDRWLAAQIGPTLSAAGMLFVGLDVIGGFVTEINVTSPTGVRELEKQFGIDIAALLIAAIAKRL